MYRFFYLFSLLLFVIPSKAQDDALFTDELYVDEVRFPGKWFLYDSVGSSGMLDTILDEFDFTAEDLFFCKKNVPIVGEIVTDTLINPWFNAYLSSGMPSYGTLDPIVQLNFEVNGKQSTAYSIKQTSAHASDIAFFLIPGSGVNQSTELQKGSGYQNMDCQIRDLLGKFGDTYVHCKPNEDFRAIRRNGAKLGDYIHEELMMRNKDYSVQYLIECMAFVKKLKEQYKQVVVVGLSQGAWATILVSDITHPDAAVVSAGYSILYDAHYPATLRDILFDKLFVEFSKDSIRDHIINSNTEYLFSYGRNDNGWSYGRAEEFNHNTENFYTGVPNVSFFFDFDYHAYPCTTVDSFVRRAVRFPEVNMELLTTESREEAHLRVNLKGRFPMAFDLFRDDTLFRHFDIGIQEEVMIPVSEYGIYEIRKLAESLSIRGFKSDVVAYNFDTAYIPVMASTKGRVILEGDSLILSTAPVYGVTYQWFRNGVLFNETVTNRFAARLTGEYTVRLNYKGWKSILSDTVQLIVFSPTVKTFPSRVDQLLPGDTVELYADEFSSFTYSWYRNGIKIADSTSRVVADKDGAYHVTVSSPANSILSSPVWKIGNAVPALNHRGDTLLFEGDDIQLSLKNYPHATYQWYKDGAITSPADSGNLYMVKDNGLYYATVISSNGTTFTTDSFNVFFVQNNLNISYDTTIYSGDTVLLFVDLPATATCEWYRNGMIIPGEKSASILAHEPGQYYARMALHTYYTRPTNKISVLVVYPELNMRGEVFIMPGDSTLLFTYEFEGLTFQWFNGEDPVVSETGREIWVKEAGTYHVQVTRNGYQQHSDTVLVNIRKVYAPLLSIQNETWLLPGESMNLSVSMLVNANYQWYKNGVLHATTTTNNLSVSQPGIYYVKVKPMFQDNIKYVSSGVSFKQYQPKLNASGDSTFWPGIAVNMSVNEMPGYTYAWYRNGSPEPGEKSTSYTATREGVYHVRVTAASGYSVNSEGLNLVTYEPMIVASGPTTIYSGDSIALTLPYQPHYTYKWYRDGNVLPAEQTYRITTGLPGDYTAEIFNGNGKVNSYNAVSVAIIYPHLSRTGIINILNGDSAELAVTSFPGIGFQWYRNNSAITGAVSSTLTIKEGGVYRVASTALSGAVSFSDSAVVEITYQELQMNRTGNLTILESDSFKFELNTIPNGSYQWYFNETPVANATSRTLVVSASGRYYAEICFNGCTVKKMSNAVSVNVYKPRLNLTQDTIIDKGEQVYLQTDYLEGMRYVWFRNDTIISTAGSSMMADREGVYYVKLITNTLHAAASNAIRVIFDDHTGLVTKVTELPGVSAHINNSMLNVTIENEESGEHTFQLVDMSGRIVMDGKMNKFEEKLVFSRPVSQLAQGLLVLRITHKTGVYVQKLLNY